MSEAISKNQLLERTRRSHAELDALFARLDDAEMLEPGLCGDWSGKDLLAHLTWHEHEMIGVIEQRALAGSDLWNLPLEQRNAAIYEGNKGRSLQDVRQEAREVYPRLLQLLEALSEEDLHDPSRFAGMPAEWRPWQIFASNTYEHYEDHIPQLRAWLGQ